MENLNSLMNNFLKNNNQGDDGTGGILLFIFFACFMIVIASAIFLLVKTVQAKPSPAPSDSGTSDTSGSPGSARSPGPGFNQLQNPLPPGVDVLDHILNDLVPEVALSIGVQAAITAALRPSGTWNLVSKGVSKLDALRLRLLQKPQFINKVTIARNAATESRVAARTISEALRAGRITALEAARMGARFARSLAEKMGLAATRAEARVATQAAVAGESIAARAAAMSALETVSTILGPAAAVYDVFGIVGLVLDSKNWGGWSEYADTQSLIDAKVKSDADQMNNLFLAKGIRYPYIVGPLDMYQTKDPTNFELDVNTEMLTALMAPDTVTGLAHPLLVNIIAELYNKRQAAGNNATIDEDFATVLDELTPQAFSTLADIALNNLCVKLDGVSFDQGVPGFPKACSFKTKEACYANSVWTYQKGVVTPPAGVPAPATGEFDGAYFEWRNPDYFQQQPIRLFNDANTYHIQNVPAAGACILQSPGFHLACDQEIHVDGKEFTGKKGTAVNQYDRERGVCYNDVPSMCDMYAVDQKSDGPTYLGRQFPTCYESTAKQAAEAAAGGYSLYRSINSCVNYAGEGDVSGSGPCGEKWHWVTDENGTHPKGVKTEIS
jgi:hypothetical protein